MTIALVMIVRDEAATIGQDNADHTHQFSIAGSSAASAHNIVQPGVMVNKIMYVGV